MATIYVFNNDTGELERFTRAAGEPMPYNTAGTLTVAEFMGDRSMGWTDLYTMNAWNELRTAYGRPIVVEAALQSISAHGCLANPQFYFGVAFMLASVDRGEMENLYDAVVEGGAFNHVDAYSRTGIMVDNRYMPSGIYDTAGLPNLFMGVRCNQVFAVQDALNVFGYPLDTDGVFGQATKDAVRKFQQDHRLTPDGVITMLEWEAIFGTGCSIRFPDTQSATPTAA
jgi:Putative peptidoglycan-binding domain-containing protein